MTKKRIASDRPANELISELQAIAQKLQPILENFAKEIYHEDIAKEAWDEFSLYTGIGEHPIEYATVFPTWYLYNWHYFPMDEDDLAVDEEEEDEDEEEIDFEELDVMDEGDLDDEDDLDDDDLDDDFADHDLPIALQYVAHAEGSIALAETQFIIAACSAPFSMFLVQEVTSQHELVLKDLLLEQQVSVVVLEPAGDFVKNTIIYARVLEMEGVSVLYGVSPFTLSAAQTEKIEGLVGSMEMMDQEVKASVLHNWDMEVRENFYQLLDSEDNAENRSEIVPMDLGSQEAALDDALMNDPSVRSLLEIILAPKAAELADSQLEELGGKSPRELVATQIGRAQVEEFLRWAQEEAPNPVIAEVMDKLLRTELGL